MNTLALWIGWGMIFVGLALALASFAVWLPYVALDALWRRLRVQDDFIRIARLYFKERRRETETP